MATRLLCAGGNLLQSSPRDDVRGESVLLEHGKVENLGILKKDEMKTLMCDEHPTQGTMQPSNLNERRPHARMFSARRDCAD